MNVTLLDHCLNIYLNNVKSEMWYINMKKVVLIIDHQAHLFDDNRVAHLPEVVQTLV